MTSLAELEEVVFGPARRGPRTINPGQDGMAFEFSVVRPLTPDDVPAIANGRPLVATPKPSGPQQLRFAHHQIAKMLVQGKNPAEISLYTGYHPNYIQSLQGGKDFAELLGFYKNQRDEIFLDVLERMKIVGVTSLERLQALLDDEDEKWSKRELMEATELLLIKSKGQGTGTGTGGISPVTVNVKFVSAEGAGTPIIDITPESDGE